MKTIRLIALIFLMLGVSSLGFAEQVKRNATITQLKGAVDVRALKTEWAPAAVGMKLNQGDFIRTKANSWAIITLEGMETATVEVKENSQMRLAVLIESKEDDTQHTLLDLALGQILVEAKKLHSEKSKFEVKTPTSIVGVRGTKFSVTVEALK